MKLFKRKEPEIIDTSTTPALDMINKIVTDLVNKKVVEHKSIETDAYYIAEKDGFKKPPEEYWKMAEEKNKK
jgi:hypothetical protein